MTLHSPQSDVNVFMGFIFFLLKPESELQVILKLITGKLERNLLRMGRNLSKDTKVWSFEPSDDVREIVNLVIESTGWNRTTIINNILGAYVGNYALEQMQAQKDAISRLEKNLKKKSNRTKQIEQTQDQIVLAACRQRTPPPKKKPNKK